MDRRTLIAAGAALLTAQTARPAAAQNASMTALIAAAKTEGSVVVDGPGVDGIRVAMTQGFERDYGIPVTYLGIGTSATGTRVRAERTAGKFLLDVLISGPDTLAITFLPNGWLDKIGPALIDPDVTNRHKWKDGHLWFQDSQSTIFRFQQYATPELAINTKLVDPRDVTTWKSLLNPKWQGKIVAKDPSTSASGGSLTSYLYLQFGPDYFRQLYIDQKPRISRDGRQAMQWLADGTYPILVGPDFVSLIEFKKLGYPIAPVFATDGPAVLSGGYGMLGLVNRAPHPNAARLFCNWILGQKAQAAFAAATKMLSLRTDIGYDSDFPAFEFPSKNKKYVDTYDYTFVTQTRDPANAKARLLLGE